jgi:hypothetical protein
MELETIKEIEEVPTTRKHIIPMRARMAFRVKI